MNKEGTPTSGPEDQKFTDDAQSEWYRLYKYIKERRRNLNH